MELGNCLRRSIGVGTKEIHPTTGQKENSQKEGFVPTKPIYDRAVRYQKQESGRRRAFDYISYESVGKIRDKTLLRVGSEREETNGRDLLAFS